MSKREKGGNSGFIEHVMQGEEELWDMSRAITCWLGHLAIHRIFRCSMCTHFTTMSTPAVALWLEGFAWTVH